MSRFLKEHFKRNAMNFLAATICYFSLAGCGSVEHIEKGEHKALYGYIVSGEKFGVKIGEAKKSAERKLIGKGFEEVEAFHCQSSTLALTIDCDGLKDLTSYWKFEPLYRIMVFIEYRDGQVGAIIWEILIGPMWDF